MQLCEQVVCVNKLCFVQFWCVPHRWYCVCLSLWWTVESKVKWMYSCDQVCLCMRLCMCVCAFTFILFSAVPCHHPHSAMYTIQYQCSVFIYTCNYCTTHLHNIIWCRGQWHWAVIHHIHTSHNTSTVCSACSLCGYIYICTYINIHLIILRRRPNSHKVYICSQDLQGRRLLTCLLYCVWCHPFIFHTYALLGSS